MDLFGTSSNRFNRFAGVSIKSTLLYITWSLLGVTKSLGYALVGLFEGFNSKFPISIPTCFICGVPPHPPGLVYCTVPIRGDLCDFLYLLGRYQKIYKTSLSSQQQTSEWCRMPDAGCRMPDPLVVDLNQYN